MPTLNIPIKRFSDSRMGEKTGPGTVTVSMTMLITTESF